MEKEIENVLKWGAIGGGIGIAILIIGSYIPSTGIKNVSLFVKVMAFPVGGFISGMIASTFNDEKKESDKEAE